ncbi:MAG: YabP/YqfC family sporulation protein [Bacilli bacterium]
MIGKIRDFILDDNFKIVINNDYIDITNYIVLYDVTDTFVFLSYDKGYIKILGKNIKILMFNNKEILLKGDFNEIKYK